MAFLFLLKKPYNFLGFLKIIYISLLSTLMNYHDGEDYFRYSLKFKEIIDEGRKILSQFEDGDRIVVKRLSENLTLESAG
ncbi:MAG: hypothetical protein ACUVUG_05935 [Candidatus Aminicenantia bacterium]